MDDRAKLIKQKKNTKMNRDGEHKIINKIVRQNK